MNVRIPAKLPIMKATPSMILGLLECVQKSEGNVLGMEICIHSFLQSHAGKQKERNVRSDVYGVTLPSLRKLRLIVGHGQLLKPNSNGRMLLRSYSQDGFIGFKYHFGRIVYDIDEAKCMLISSLRDSLQGTMLDSVSYEDLVLTLTKKGIDTSQKDERLRKWLPFLKFVDLVRDVDEGRLGMNLQLIEEYELGKNTVKFETFEKIVFEEYDKLATKEGVYVTIFVLEERTCNKLIDDENFFTTFDFERYLILLLRKYSSLKKKKILLSQPGKREEEGVYVDNAYYYYISIYDVEED